MYSKRAGKPARLLLNEAGKAGPFRSDPEKAKRPKRASRTRGMGRWVASSIGGPKVLPTPLKE